MVPNRERDRHIMKLVADLRTMMLAGKPDAALIRRMIREAKPAGISAATLAKLLMVAGNQTWQRERKQKNS